MARTKTLTTRKILLPEANFLEQCQTNEDEILRLNTPTVLLSKISDIDRSIVMRLEMAGVYDNQDLFNAGMQLMDYLGMSRGQYTHLVQTVKSYSMKEISYPQFILDLPTNFALVSATSSNTTNCLALTWSGIMWIWESKASEGWHQIRHQFSELIRKLEYPELIGVASKRNLPMWLNKTTDISTFVKGILASGTLGKYAYNWGAPNVPYRDLAELAKQEIMQIVYIFHLAGLFQKKSKIVTEV